MLQILRKDLNSCKVTEGKVSHFFVSSYSTGIHIHFPSKKRSQADRRFQRIIIVDCRYEYEYLGGHITEQHPWLLVCVSVLNGVSERN